MLEGAFCVKIFSDLFFINFFLRYLYFGLWEGQCLRLGRIQLTALISLTVIFWTSKYHICPPPPNNIPIRFILCLFVPIYILDKLFMPYLIVPMFAKKCLNPLVKIDCILVLDTTGMSLVSYLSENR